MLRFTERVKLRVLRGYISQMYDRCDIKQTMQLIAHMDEWIVAYDRVMSRPRKGPKKQASGCAACGRAKSTLRAIPHT